jgi:hypothetical protein
MILKDVTDQFLSFSDVTFQDDVPTHGAPLGVFRAPIALYPNRKAIPVPADKPR